MKLLITIIIAVWIPCALGEQHDNIKQPKPVIYVSEEPTEIVTSFYKRLADKLPKEDYALQETSLKDLPINSNNNILYIAVGSQVLARLLEKNLKSPILAIFISRVAYNQVMRAYGSPNGRLSVSAIFSDPSPQHQLFLTKAIFQSSPKIAVILTEKTAFLKTELELAAMRTSVPLGIIVHIEDNEFARTLNMARDSKALLAIPDDSIYSSETLRTVILSAYRRNQSIIGFSRQLVKAGGLATVYYDADHIFSRTTDFISRYLTNENLPAPGYPEEFSVDTNDHVADSFGLSLPSAEELEKSIVNMLEKKHEN